ncbi:hypothetical protein [Hymenobacter nivis]|uniref:Lipoprotein n=1 Tax=Hymenobacter nivis TaxID=1850093 RepID=A0A502GX19_9BACT|nr:hypothetical protein [Hymenobacter nivis]TPG66541.1 hypothetical protein EAH73_09055 [Hymenobacter nivis]
MKKSSRLAVLLLLASAACRPDAPATEQAATPAAAPVPAALPSVAASPAAPGPTDTLHLPGERVAQLHPSTVAAFNQLPASSLPELANEPEAEPLPASQGQVRRQGLDLLLQPAQGSAAKLASTPDAEFTLQNAKGVKYMYWGSLPAAHQWVVRAWYWESVGTVLVDQRTGRYVELMGEPVASPDGRFVLLTSPGLGGGDQANLLTLVEITADGPRLLWEREPTTWEPVAARWAAPGRVLIERRHTLADGSMADDARVTYDELTVSR